MGTSASDYQRGYDDGVAGRNTDLVASASYARGYRDGAAVTSANQNRGALVVTGNAPAEGDVPVFSSGAWDAQQTMQRCTARFAETFEGPGDTADPVFTDLVDDGYRFVQFSLFESEQYHGLNSPEFAQGSPFSFYVDVANPAWDDVTGIVCNLPGLYLVSMRVFFQLNTDLEDVQVTASVATSTLNAGMTDETYTIDQGIGPYEFVTGSGFATVDSPARQSAVATGVGFVTVEEKLSLFVYVSAGAADGTQYEWDGDSRGVSAIVQVVRLGN